jgi:hypothetical protein
MRRFVPPKSEGVAAAPWGQYSLRFFNKPRPAAPNSSSTGTASSSPSLLQRIPILGVFFGGGARISRKSTRVEAAAKKFVNPVMMGFSEAVGTSKGHRNAYHTFLLRLQQGGHSQLHFALTNMGGLAMYQLIMEGGITLLVFTGLFTGNFTPSGIRQLFEGKIGLPASWVGIEGSEFEADVPIYLWRKLGMYSVRSDVATGSRSVVRDEGNVEPVAVLPKEVLTQLNMGHNIAILLMPIQIPLLFATFPTVAAVWRGHVFPRINSIPFVRQLFPRLGADESIVTPITAKATAPKSRGYGLPNKIHASQR